jgi:ABC-type sugar transport system, periplasmic component
MAYIGQELLISGQAVGKRLASLMKKGDTAVGVIAQPGSLNIQPRHGRRTQALEAAGMKVMFGNKGLDSGASATQEAQVIPQFLQANGSKIQGIFAVDGGSTALLGTSLQKNNLVGKVQAGGFDLEPQTLAASRPARSPSPSTSRRTCRASCPPCTSTSSSSPAAWYRRRPRTPA